MKTSDIPKYIRVLLIFTAVNLLVLGLRNYVVGDKIFSFLKSNLLSGIAPCVIAIIIQHFYDKLNKVFFILLSLLWLIFYPNSPYMISDLIHSDMDTNNATDTNLIVFNTLIIFSIAMLSVFYGFVSLKIMFNLFKKRWGNKTAHTVIFLSLALSCLGFYMGRELLSAIKLGNGYLYSWEIFLEPVQIIKIVWNALFPISEHWHAYAMMALFGMIQWMLIVMFKDVGDIESSTVVTKDE